MTTIARIEVVGSAVKLHGQTSGGGIFYESLPFATHKDAVQFAGGIQYGLQLAGEAVPPLEKKP